MTRKLILGVALLIVLLAWSVAEAVTANCAPNPLPAEPSAGTPSYTFNPLTFSGKSLVLKVWRHTCADTAPEIVILMRATPGILNDGPFLCDPLLRAIQNGAQYTTALRPTAGDNFSSFCDTLLVPTTVLIAFQSIQPTFDKGAAFRLVYNTSYFLDVPIASTQPPPPPSLTIVATGCTTCHSGQTVGYRLDFTNGGPPFVAELKGGARFPDGTGLSLLNQVTTIPVGASSLTFVPSQALPGGLPTIDLTIEAAILDPIFGVTLSRGTATLHLLP